MPAAACFPERKCSARRPMMSSSRTPKNCSKQGLHPRKAPPGSFIQIRSGTVLSRASTRAPWLATACVRRTRPKTSSPPTAAATIPISRMRSPSPEPPRPHPATGSAARRQLPDGNGTSSVTGREAKIEASPKKTGPCTPLPSVPRKASRRPLAGSFNPAWRYSLSASITADTSPQKRGAMTPPSAGRKTGSRTMMPSPPCISGSGPATTVRPLSRARSAASRCVGWLR